MNIHQQSVTDALASLHTTAQGLSSGEAQRRLQQFGPNHVAPAKRRNRLWALLAEFTQLFSVVLWIAALLAFAVEWQVPGEGMGRLGVAIVAVILISGVFSYWQEYRIEKALSALVKLLPQQVQVQRDGTVQAIMIDDLVPGDLMLLAEGDSVPADGRLIEASGMRVNNATITGEATAELRDASACDSEDRLHARNIVLAGTSITSDKGTAVVLAVPQIAPWNGAQRIDELPFDAFRMCMSVIYDFPEGRVLLCKGALEKLLPLCESTWHLQRPEPLSRELRANILNAQERMADRGLRVLALAWRWLPPGQEPCEQGLILAGLAGLQDPPRPEVPAAIIACRQAGIKTIMVTGDHPNTAVAIARQIGLVTIASPLVLSGEQITNLSHTQLLLALDAPQIICARISVDQKLRIVTALEGKGEIVAVTGDGVNDAPALKHAHVGIAMGVSGTDVAREAADMVLLDDNFASIVSAIAEGRAVFDNIRKFLTYILAHNMAELIPYLCFALAGFRWQSRRCRCWPSTWEPTH